MFEDIYAFHPEIGLILGSGLGDYAEKIDNPLYIDYSSIPGFPVSHIEGHKNRFVIGTLNNKRVITMQGRFHYYEGYRQQEMKLPIRMMRDFGVKILIITNAAGGINPSFKPGDLMLITDHINMSGSNPLFGPNDDKYGPRFPDMSEVYSKRLRDIAINTAILNNISLKQGVYVMATGPSYETPAEIRMFKTLGCDAVGMSTVPEAIIARHSGMEILGISCITNMAAGILNRELNHEEVIETAKLVKKDFENILDKIIGSDML